MKNRNTNTNKNKHKCISCDALHTIITVIVELIAIIMFATQHFIIGIMIAFVVWIVVIIDWIRQKHK